MDRVCVGDGARGSVWICRGDEGGGDMLKWVLERYQVK
jgi:hypothetical protein